MRHGDSGASSPFFGVMSGRISHRNPHTIVELWLQVPQTVKSVECSVDFISGHLKIHVPTGEIVDRALPALILIFSGDNSISKPFEIVAIPNISKEIRASDNIDPVIPNSFAKRTRICLSVDIDVDRE